MSDPAQPQAPAAITVMPTPSCIRPRRAGDETPARPGGVGLMRTGVRDRLGDVLAGVRLSARDRQFLGRLVHWDKRHAAAVASLLGRARQAGREEAGLTPRQRELVIAALGDAAVYRVSGIAGSGCWDCEMVPGGRCADHVKDTDRARAYAELAALLAGPGARNELELPGLELPEPPDLAGYRERTPVAS